MGQWVLLLTTGFLSHSNHRSHVSYSFQEEFFFHHRQPGRTGKAAPFPANTKQKAEQRVPCAMSHSVVPQVYPPSLQRVQQQQCPTAGRRHQRNTSAYTGVSAIHGCPIGLWFYSFHVPDNTLQGMPQVQTSSFTRFLHILINTFSPLPALGTVSMRWNTKLFLLLTLLCHWQGHDILSLCLAGIAFLWERGFPSSSFLLWCFRWCGHLKSEFLIQQGC